MRILECLCDARTRNRIYKFNKILVGGHFYHTCAQSSKWKSMLAREMHKIDPMSMRRAVTNFPTTIVIVMFPNYSKVYKSGI